MASCWETFLQAAKGPGSLEGTRKLCVWTASPARHHHHPDPRLAAGKMPQIQASPPRTDCRRGGLGLGASAHSLQPSLRRLRGAPGALGLAQTSWGPPRSPRDEARLQPAGLALHSGIRGAVLARAPYELPAPECHRFLCNETSSPHSAEQSAKTSP